MKTKRIVPSIAFTGTLGEWFQFAVALGSSDALIGDLGLHFHPSESRLAELGFTFSSAHQG
jgi:RimJ/RimL family protein N-acetyltransferase